MMPLQNRTMLQSAVVLTCAMTTAIATPAAAKGDDDARRAMADFAQCAVNRQHDAIATAIVEDWDNRMLSDARPAIFVGGCVRSPAQRARLQMGGPAVKAALAEYLVSRDVRTPPTRTFGDVAPLAYRLPTPLIAIDAQTGKALNDEAIDAQRKAIAEKAWLVSLERFGECVVRADPAGAHALLVDSPVASDAETAAIKALAPVIPKCVASGETVKFNRAMVRGTIAIAYYRLAMAAKGKRWNGGAAPPSPSGEVR